MGTSTRVYNTNKYTHCRIVPFRGDTLAQWDKTVDTYVRSEKLVHLHLFNVPINRQLIPLIYQSEWASLFGFGSCDEILQTPSNSIRRLIPCDVVSRVDGITFIPSS